MPKSKIEILAETVAYYSEDVNRRAYNKIGGCEYVTDDGRMCAFGRCMIDPVNIPLPIPGRSVMNQPSYIDINEWLKPEYQGYDKNFWYQIQALHDIPQFWDTKGLTDKGYWQVIDLTIQYSKESNNEQGTVCSAPSA